MPRKLGEKAPGARALRAQSTNWLYLIRLLCNKTEDSFGADEAYLAVNGITRWGIVSVNDGDTVDLEATTEPVRFRTSVRLELWDNDTGIFDSDDRLGEIIVAPDDNYPYDQERFGTFSDDGARYVLTYVVSKEGP